MNKPQTLTVIIPACDLIYHLIGCDTINMSKSFALSVSLLQIASLVIFCFYAVCSYHFPLQAVSFPSWRNRQDLRQKVSIQQERLLEVNYFQYSDLAVQKMSKLHMRQ